MPEGSSDLIENPTNTNRTTLKIINDKYQDPIKAKVEYNKTTGLVEVTITYSKYGINRITFEDTTELQMTNTNGIITATTEGITLESGNHKITITDKNGTAKKLNVRVPLEYGREVLGYECDVPDVKWRLFHVDDENIYLIADDYIPYANLPTSTSGTALNKGNTDYNAYFTNIQKNYTGSSWIKENTHEQAKNWLSWINRYPSSTNNNIKAVAYMMDTDSWSSFRGEKAEYAIGGPTLELFCASYKVTHPDRYVECNSTNANGYQLKWSNGSYSNYVSGLTKDDYSSIYIKSSTTKAYGMWIASPIDNSSSRVTYAFYNGGVGNGSYSEAYFGFRPVVCLKSGTKLMDNGDNTYSIKEPIMASAEYNETNGTIEIIVRYSENGIAKIEDENGKAISYSNENGIIKAVTPAVGGKNKFTITDNKGNTKELEVLVILPIYATLYTDGTLALSASNKTIEGKTVANTYGDISKIDGHNAQIAWFNQRTSITTVDIVDKIYPISTQYWFSGCNNLGQINNINNLNISSTTSMRDMFYDCTSLTQLDITSFDTSNVTNMAYMFNGCSSLTELDVSNLDTSNVTNMASMFYDCSSLTKLDLSNFNTSNVTDMSSMFRNCSSLTELDVSNFNTNNVTSMNCMFYVCSNLTKLDVSNFNTSKVTDMQHMFFGCKSLIKLDVSNFNTSNVTNMSYMFHQCIGLTSLDLSKFNTNKVTNMYGMFEYCRNLTSLDLSKFNTGNVTDMQHMFYNCSSLTSLNVSSFNTSNVTKMNYMFSGCSSLTSLNVSSFNTSNVANMNYMFNDCSSLTSLDLSSFNTNKVTNMSRMFSFCSNLKIIYVGANWKLATTTTNMFDRCGTSSTTRK